MNDEEGHRSASREGLERSNLPAIRKPHGGVSPTNGPITQRRQTRGQWFQTVLATLCAADLVFADPDNGLEPAGFSHGSAKAGKSGHPGRATGAAAAWAVPHRVSPSDPAARRTSWRDGYWAARLRQAGFQMVEAFRANP